MLTITNGWRAVAVKPHPGIEPGAKGYQKEVGDGHLSVIVGHSEVGWHLSISHRRSVLDARTGKPVAGRIPTWEEIKEARYLFVPDEVYMAQILPPRSKYINFMETCMHLWEVPEAAALGVTEQGEQPS